MYMGGNKNKTLSNTLTSVKITVNTSVTFTGKVKYQYLLRSDTGTLDVMM
jgi:hypothetical protein